MLRKLEAFFFVKNQRFLPVMATLILFFVAYAAGAIAYPGMRNPQVFFNLFRNNSFLLISAVGMTFVILSGGIDLSVSGVVALTTVASAALLREGWNPWAVMALMLLMGMALGAAMGAFITYLKVQPFIATLAGMWFARGMCFFISDDAIPINNRVYTILARTKILIPGLSDPVAQTGNYISILVVVMMVVLGVAMYIAHYTPFGRAIYAIGGNEQSARLMGLPVNRVKMLVYTLNGFCSALAGIALSITVSSGHGLYAQGFELTVIAAVVIGGTMLTGGQGYVFGTLVGVLVIAVIQTLIQFNGKLSSWWTSIVIGLLTLFFIGVQSLLAARQARQGSGRKIERATAPAPKSRFAWAMGGVLAAVAVVAASWAGMRALRGAPIVAGGATKEVACERQPFRQDQAAVLVEKGAVVVYERNGGPHCVDELYAIYPDGRITADNGVTTLEKQITSEEVSQLLEKIVGFGWFTHEMYNTWHVPCSQCYGYYITVTRDGETKTVKAVDGGTDAPATYWQVVGAIHGVIPKFENP
jgi:simple sugar transport system permease protein